MALSPVIGQINKGVRLQGNILYKEKQRRFKMKTLEMKLDGKWYSVLDK